MIEIKRHSFEEAASIAAAFAEVFGPEYRRNFTPAARVARPVCACCAKPYGLRNTETTRTTVTEKPEPYRGNAFMVQEEIFQYGVSTDKPVAMLVRTTWDGESYSAPYKPFCTLRCALQFARSAHRAGWRS